MCNLSYAIEEKGYAKGIEIGRAEGIEQISKLVYRLNSAGRLDDITKASVDKDYRDRLLKEFNLI